VGVSSLPYPVASDARTVPPLSSCTCSWRSVRATTLGSLRPVPCPAGQRLGLSDDSGRSFADRDCEGTGLNKTGAIGLQNRRFQVRVLGAPLDDTQRVALKVLHSRRLGSRPSGGSRALGLWPSRLIAVRGDFGRSQTDRTPAVQERYLGEAGNEGRMVRKSEKASVRSRELAGLGREDARRRDDLESAGKQVLSARRSASSAARAV